MKFCPYCGAELVSGTASFCSECGKGLAVENEPSAIPENKKSSSAPKQQRIHKTPQKGTEKRSRRNKVSPSQNEENAFSSQQTDFDGYDGYYDDVLPSDIDREREEIDVGLLKKVGIIAGGVALIIILCLIALYFL